jgi:hypothetical protein
MSSGRSLGSSSSYISSLGAPEGVSQDRDVRRVYLPGLALQVSLLGSKVYVDEGEVAQQLNCDEQRHKSCRNSHHKRPCLMLCSDELIGEAT